MLEAIYFGFHVIVYNVHRYLTVIIVWYAGLFVSLFLSMSVMYQIINPDKKGEKTIWEVNKDGSLYQTEPIQKHKIG